MARRHNSLVCQHLENSGVDALANLAQAIAHWRHVVYALSIARASSATSAWRTIYGRGLAIT